MKREIKFRVWHNEWNKMYKVRSIHFNDKGKIIGLHYKLTGGRIGAAVCIDTYLEIDSVELMQYTGLKDMHGKEIYEGDIVGVKDTPAGVVGFEEGRFCGIYTCHTTSGWDYSDEWEGSLASYASSYEVIGNIYENPNLIK